MNAVRTCACVFAFALAIGGLATSPLRADTQLGDAGHYLTLQPECYLLNPDGRASRLTLHRFPWWIGRGWNRSDLAVKITDGAGQVVFERTVEVPDETAIELPAGAPGTWKVNVDSHSGLNFWYLASSLDHSVVRVAAKEKFDLVPSFCFNPFVPRTWYFWVPPGTERFKLRAPNTRGRSHREDHGLTIISPRGQRMAVLWGQANPDAPKIHPVGERLFAQQDAEIIVEKGTAGRFWSLEVRMGDSHTFSDISVLLEGVPPYLARSPEEWFNPDDALVPAKLVYDESAFVQSHRLSKPAGPVGPKIDHWTPAPSLGDPDGVELRTPVEVALLNPENRELKLVIGTYLPRKWFSESVGPNTRPGSAQIPQKHLRDDQLDHASVKAVTADGKVLLDEPAPLYHLHDGKQRWEKDLTTGPGAIKFTITKAERFWMYTYPATPAVLMGSQTEEGWSRFELEAGTARNWYFHVPRGTKSFQVRHAAAHAGDVADVRVAAPDRTVAISYSNRGTSDVVVPPGMDGKIWHVRIDFGDATRFTSTAADPRFPSLRLTLELRGVPGYLAPTWEQWFDPRQPVTAQHQPTTRPATH